MLTSSNSIGLTKVKRILGERRLKEGINSKLHKINGKPTPELKLFSLLHFLEYIKISTMNILKEAGSL